jgi:hypothetical protein
MKISRVTVLYRHVEAVRATLRKVDYKRKSLTISAGVVVVHFDFKDFDTSEHLFGVPYSLESVIKGQKKTYKMQCTIDESGVPSYLCDSVIDVKGWIEQENIYRVQEQNEKPNVFPTRQPIVGSDQFTLKNKPTKANFRTEQSNKTIRRQHVV